LNDSTERDPRLVAIPDIHGHAKGEHKPYAEERPLPLTARMLFLWFYHACRRGYPRFLMVADHMNYLTFEDPAAVNLVRRALKLAGAGDLYGAAETANVEVGHAAVVSEGLRRGMRYSIGAEVDNDPRSRPDAQNIVDAMRPDAIIRSVHFVPITHPVHGENWNWPFDNPEFAELFDVVGTDALWESYITILVDAIERLPGHIVGHLYVPAVFGHWPDPAKLSAYEDRVLDAAAARGMAIEFNTRFLYRDHPDEEKDRYMTANRRLLRKAKERGVQIAIGSDAHSPRDQGNGFEIVLGVLDELDINELVFPLGGSLRRVALRVVREPEPEPPPPPEPVVVAKPARASAAAAGNGTSATPTRKKTAAAAATPATAPVPAKPAKVKPVADKPVVDKPVAAKPVAAKTPSPKAAPAKPVAVKPVARPVAVKPVAAKPVVAKPVVAKPVAVKPVAVKPVAAKPVAKVTAAKPVPKAAVKAKPAAKPARGKPAPAKAAAKAKPVAKKAAPAKKAVPAKRTAAKAPAKKAAPKKPAKAVAAKRAPVRVKPVAKKAIKKAAPARPAAKKAGRGGTARPVAARRPAAKKVVKKTPAKRR
jgi:HisJ family histidinol phosphate phosphatase